MSDSTPIIADLGPAEPRVSLLYIPMSEEDKLALKKEKIPLASGVDTHVELPLEGETTVAPTKGIVLYPDGSTRPNPGWGGLGVHGYSYENVVPKKGSGNTSQILTNLGYVPKAEIKKAAKAREADDDQPQVPSEVKPLCYWDAYVTLPKGYDNNYAEIKAGERALQMAWEYHQTDPIVDAKLWSDSQNFLNAANNKLSYWKNNNWHKENGDKVKHIPTWQNIDSLLTLMRDAGIEVKLQWCRGHSTHLGNIQADTLANMGSSQSIDGFDRNFLLKSETAGYWSDKYEKHPFIFHKSIYFNTRQNSHVPGEYYFGEASKEIELLGKRTADGRFSAVILKQPDPYIETTLQRLFDAAGPKESLMLGHLDRLFSHDAVRMMERFGSAALYRHDKRRMDLNLADKTLVVRELDTVRIAYRAVETVNTLKGILLGWKAGDKNIIATEITDLLYDTDPKKGLKLKSEFVVGRTDLKVQANRKKDMYSEDSDVLPVELHLVMGVDSLDRNAFKKLEKREAKVYVVTWMESPQALRYATIVQLDEDLGIWCGAYSNLRIL